MGMEKACRWGLRAVGISKHSCPNQEVSFGWYVRSVAPAALVGPSIAAMVVRQQEMQEGHPLLQHVATARAGGERLRLPPRGRRRPGPTGTRSQRELLAFFNSVVSLPGGLRGCIGMQFLCSRGIMSMRHQG